MECLEDDLVGRLNSGISLGENELPDEFLGLLSVSDQLTVKLRRENLMDLRAIQKIILFEEDQWFDLEGVLARVLAFYHRFVTYK